MKIFIGKVTALKTAKTATVAVERVIIHPLYKKRFRRDAFYQVHDELGVKIGDQVRFAASKPYSKTKKWKIIAAFKKTPGSRPGDELNADMSSSFKENRGLKSAEDVIEVVKEKRRAK